jgi:hypothetical protein
VQVRFFEKTSPKIDSRAAEAGMMAGDVITRLIALVTICQQSGSSASEGWPSSVMAGVGAKDGVDIYSLRKLGALRHTEHGPSSSLFAGQFG